MDVGVAWHSDARDAVDLQATLIGGVCNDFDARGPDYFHGLTTEVDGGVLVTLHFAVVEGAPSLPWSVAIYDRKPPTPTEGLLDDTASRSHVHCVKVDDAGVTGLPRSSDAPAAEWLTQGTAVQGIPAQGPTALRGFALAFDPAGFELGGSRPLTDEEAFVRNNYVYRYLVRALPGVGGTFVEAGITHGIHRAGPFQDNAIPSALAARVDLTTFPGLTGTVANDFVYERRDEDPNLLPEDGYVRWATTTPAAADPRCSSSW
jgi:hypothetical protein